VKAIALAVLIALSTGCSVNVIVAPGATLAVESLNERNKSAPEVYLVE
jgi:hypothetical protein